MTLLARWREPPPATINSVAVYHERADAWWSEVDRSFAPLRAMAAARLIFLARHGVPLQGSRVLDVGAGGGFLSIEMAQRGALVLALDLAPRALAAARAEAERRGLSLSTIAASAERVPLWDARFPLVVCTDVLPHIVEQQLIFDELARLVAPGGKLLVATMNSTALARFVLITLGEDILGVLPRGTHDPRTFVSPEELARQMRARGLTHVVTEGTSWRRFGVTFGRSALRAIMYQALFTK